MVHCSKDKDASILWNPTQRKPAVELPQQELITPRDGTFFLLRTDRDVESPRWFHVKLIVLGSRVTVYLNDTKEPVLVVDKMLDAKTRGNVGVWGLQDVYFTNFRYTPTD